MSTGYAEIKKLWRINYNLMLVHYYLKFVVKKLRVQAALAICWFAICGFDYLRIIFNAQNLVSVEFPLIIGGFLPILS